MIGFKALRAVIAELHGEGATPGALPARFKYFQRMEFPGGSNVGRGSRASYALGDVLALALAFELLETSVTPVRVVRLLRSGWPAIERAIVSTWLALESRGGRALLLAHTPGALGELGRAESETAPAADPLAIIARDTLVEWLDAKGEAGAPSLYLIELSRFVREVASAIMAVGGVGGDDLRDHLDELARRAFGSDRTADWTAEADGLNGPRARSGTDFDPVASEVRAVEV